jgi:hypothetical protein
MAQNTRETRVPKTVVFSLFTVALGLAVVVGSSILLNQPAKTTSTEKEATNKPTTDPAEIQKRVATRTTVGKEAPRLFVIADTTTVPKNAFFARAQKNDVVLAYEESKIFILFRTDGDKVIALSDNSPLEETSALAATPAPEATATPETSPSPVASPTSTPTPTTSPSPSPSAAAAPVKLSWINATTTVGKTQTVENSLTAEVQGQYTAASRTATKQTLSSQVVYRSESAKALATTIATALKYPLKSQFSSEEVPADTEIIVVVGE